MTTAAYKVEEVEDCGDAPCSCDGCTWTGPASDTSDVQSCALTPGDASPVGRCPECDSLCYLDEPIRKSDEFIRTALTKQVIEQCGGDLWGECKRFPKKDWMAAVEASETMLGYWEYVIAEAESAEVDIASLV